jgi:signal transduction histidine kinase
VGTAGHRVRWNRSDWFDLTLAAGALGISTSILLTLPPWSPEPLTWFLVLAHNVPIAFRRRAPRAAFATSIGAAAIYLTIGWPMVGLGLASVVMTYSLAAYSRRRVSLAGLTATEVLLVVLTVVGRANPQLDTLLGNLLMLAAAWIMGDATRRRRDDALAEQRRMARDAVAQERLRIARELHDVVAHSMSVIAVQAGTGRTVIDDDPDLARQALISIEQTSQQALAEMRRLLGVLRAESGDPASLSPVPTLDDLDRLVAHAVQGGTPVDVVVGGDRRAVPAGIGLAAYRVLQEALTNVRRHAPSAPARVHVEFEPDAIVVEVENALADGTPATPATPPGHGLIGMRERVELYGGEFQAGPKPDGSFRLHARIPYDARFP